jgi:hypothetical protein
MLMRFVSTFNFGLVVALLAARQWCELGRNLTAPRFPPNFQKEGAAKRNTPGTRGLGERAARRNPPRWTVSLNSYHALCSSCTVHPPLQSHPQLLLDAAAVKLLPSVRP